MYLSDIVEAMGGAPEFRALARALKEKQRSVWADGLMAPARALFQAALQLQETSAPLLVLTPTMEHAEQRCEDLLTFGVAGARLFSQLDLPAAGAAMPASIDMGALRERLQVLQDLVDGVPGVFIAPITAALQPAPNPERFNQRTLTLQPGATLSLEKIAQELADLGYERVATVEEPGQFAVRGGILDVFPFNDSQPSRLDLFGDEIDSIRALDVGTQRSLQKRDRLQVLPPADTENSGEATLLDYLPEDALLIVEDPRQIEARWEEFGTAHGEDAAAEALSRRKLADGIEKVRRRRVVYLTLGARSVHWDPAAKAFPLTTQASGNFATGLASALEAIDQWRASGWQVVIASDRPDRLVEVLTQNGVAATSEGLPRGKGKADKDAPASKLPVASLRGMVSDGFLIPSIRLAVLTDSEVFGTRKVRRPRRGARQGRRITSLNQIKEGDLVVHLQHGIGHYRGMVKQSVGGVERDYLHLEYADNTRLYVPVDQIDRITKYIGSEEFPPPINRIGGNEWARTTAKARARVREMAGELVKLYAAREAAQGYAFNPDTPWQQEMEESFVYEETQDQLTAISEMKRDMERQRPMDRLICGDVGYGKTEVAIRGAFKAVMDGKQVAVLVPTTVLAQQHYNTFTERLAAFPLRIEVVSRFRSPRTQKRILQDLSEGNVDILIGTHRLLSKDVVFNNLGLVIVDEEQRFGVAHKEKLKQLRTSVDVLTLTATPIPRTLHMSLSGLRDMSLINDPPEGRTPVRTYCMEREDSLIRAAILREIDRDGQVYFVHNRVENIEQIAESLRRLAPGARIGVGHGQMREGDLEKVMLDFYDHHYDVLVCTTIIESGLDIPNANTMIINEATNLGLAQLYQLRGRVGRSPRQAYCYLLYDPRRSLSEIAEKRLEAIREFTELGSGFQIALRDLEIRGAGNLLGAEQHGFLLSVGFDLYCRMIADAVRELRGEEVQEFNLPPVDLPLNAHLPAEYVADDRQRLDLYRRMATVHTPADVQALEAEVRDRFGKPPEPAQNLLGILGLRAAAAAAGVESIECANGQILVKLNARTRLTEKEIQRLSRNPAARRPGCRWVQIRTDRIGIELQAGSALAAAAAAVRALSERSQPIPEERAPRKTAESRAAYSERGHAARRK